MLLFRCMCICFVRKWAYEMLKLLHNHMWLLLSQTHPFFTSCGICILYIFRRKLSKNCKKKKKKKRFHVFVAYINEGLRDQLTWYIALINKPHVVNNFFAFLEATDEHCFDAFIPRYKIKPWVWKSNHRNALLCWWKSDLYRNSDFWCWVLKVFY